MKNLLRLGTTCLLLMLAIVSRADAFKDFSVIVNNQEGTLLTDEEISEKAAFNFGVAVDNDGKVSRVAANDAKAVATVSGTLHGEHGSTGLKVVVPNAGNVKITVGQCTYSAKTITVTNANGEVVASKAPSSPACWKNSRDNVDVLFYQGEATTLTITGMDYCPYVAVNALTEDEIAALNATYTLTYYDLDGSVVGTQEVKGQEPIGAFKYGAEDLAPIEGVVFRGWFTTPEGGRKYKVEDKVESDLALYAVATMMEIPFPTATFSYNLADANFYPEDHECIEIVGDKCYWHDASHGWAFYNGEKINLRVGGDATITIVNCQYGNGTNIAVVDANTGETIGSLPAKSDSDGGVATFEYEGGSTILSLVMESNGEMYIHSIAIANHEQEVPAEMKITWSWQEGYPVTIGDVHIEGDTGLVPSDVDGIALFVDATNGKLKSNGDNVQFNKGTIIRVPVVSSNDIVTVVAHPYNFTEIKIGGNIYTTETTEYKANAADAANGYVEIEATTNFYLYSITVVQKAPKKLATLDNEPATATFAFSLGTEDQKADFGDANDYFVTSKVTYGSNLSIFGTRQNQTQFMPEKQQNEGENGTAADESNAIRFLIQPSFGLTFTPKKVSLKTTRYGTDNGLLDISWENPDKSTVSLAVGVKPERDGISSLSYDIEGATPSEGKCGLLVNLYHLQKGKQIGFSDIIIEGTLSGTEKEVPVLATLTINGKEYTSEKIFDDAYEAVMELSKKDPMIGETNPVEATAKKGEVGIIGYVGDETKCVVTIPMTFGETTVDYVLNIVQKPDFTLYYISPEDGTTVLTTQQVEKDSPIGFFAGDAMSNYGIPEGYAMRGWFAHSGGGRKFTVEDIVTSDLYLYGYCTEIETASTYKKYTYDLTDKEFDPAEHEAFNPSGDKFYWHDTQHGWVFAGKNKIDLLVGPKATVFVTLCRYGNANDIVITENGNEIGKIPGKNNENVDAEIVAFNYEGEGGTITLNLESEGEMYIHAVKIVNTAETNYDSEGNWYFVKPGSADSFVEVLEIVNGNNAAKDAERSFIFLPDGTYDLRQTVKTAISGHNISIIGQSMDGTIIMTKPDKQLEGLGSADMLHNSGTNLYMQDLTLKNALDYYGALGGGQVGGRAAVIQDAGNRTIYKNVRMLSYQDTYYSSNDNMQSYFEDCDIHGTVDFICGGGDVRFQNTQLTLEPRQLDGKGSRTIVAPRGTVKFGYVFDNCKVVDLAEGKGNWNLGRTWNNDPMTVYLNTTLDEHAAATLIASRWIEKGMNNKDPKVFGEYNTMDINGNNITPESNIIKSYGGEFQTILTADQAANYSYDMMFKENLEKQWDPAMLARQFETPADAKYANGTVTFSLMDNGMTGCAIFKNGEFAGLSTSGIFDITIDPAVDELTIRTGNWMGGLGAAAHVDGTATGIKATKVAEGKNTIFNLQGQRVKKAGKGIYIINGKKTVVK